MSRKIGQYEIKRELGQGGMGTVYLGLDPRLEREVAIKVLKPNLYMDDPTFSARFEQEAKTVASLTHNCIVPVYDYHDDGQWRYFVMPYMSGGSLQDRLEKGAIPLEKAVSIVRRVASGLEKAHINGIIHRDLKPGNILFDQENEAYLSDFGIMKLADPTGERTVQMTQTGLALGTPHYMSPEQLDGAGDLDGRSDIYALGIILYEMLAGKKPYDHESMPRIIAMHYNSPIPNILEANPNLLPGIADVIRRAMAKKREERYGTVREMYMAVHQAVTSQAAPQIPERKDQPAAQPPKQQPAVVPKPSRTAEQAVNAPVTTPIVEQAEIPQAPPAVTGRLARSRSDHPKLVPGLFLFFSGLPMMIITLYIVFGSAIVFEIWDSIISSGLGRFLAELGFRIHLGFLLIPVSILAAPVTGFLQWLFLRNYLARAWLWIPVYFFINLIASFVFYLLYLEVALTLRFSLFSNPALTLRLLIILLMGFPPAFIGLIWLFSFSKKKTI